MSVHACLMIRPLIPSRICQAYFLHFTSALRLLALCADVSDDPIRPFWSSVQAPRLTPLKHLNLFPDACISTSGDGASPDPAVQLNHQDAHIPAAQDAVAAEVHCSPGPAGDVELLHYFLQTAPDLCEVPWVPKVLLMYCEDDQHACEMADSALPQVLKALTRWQKAPLQSLTLELKSLFVYIPSSLYNAFTSCPYLQNLVLLRQNLGHASALALVQSAPQLTKLTLQRCSLSHDVLPVLAQLEKLGDLILDAVTGIGHIDVTAYAVATSQKMHRTLQTTGSQPEGRGSPHEEASGSTHQPRHASLQVQPRSSQQRGKRQHSIMVVNCAWWGSFEAQLLGKLTKKY